jgi:hypothetical protein
MSDVALNILAKTVFGGSLIAIIYVVYREFTLNRIRAENAEISLGEKTNEDLVNSESDAQLVNDINAEFGPTSNASTTKPASALPGSPIANGNAKKSSN